MRMVKLEGATAIDPRRHFLVVLTPECLEKQPLAVPIFEIVNGRHGRIIECESPEGHRILSEGRNVLYVGATNIYGLPVRNAPIKDVLEGLLASGTSENLRTCITRHLTRLAALDAPCPSDAAA